MVEKREATSSSGEPPETDDLKRITGIGPAVERRLHGIGVYTFAQFAALSPADIAAAVAGLSGLTAERIAKQDWIGQARGLARGLKTTEPEPIIIAEVEPLTPALEEVGPPSPALPEPEPVAPVGAPPIAERAEIGPPVMAAPRFPGVLHLRDLEVVAADSQEPQTFLFEGQPFSVCLTLDLTDITMPDDIPLSYKVSIYSKSLEGHPLQMISETQGTITPTDIFTVSVPGAALPRGVYRLRALVTLRPKTKEAMPHADLVTITQSGLFQVY